MKLIAFLHCWRYEYGGQRCGVGMFFVLTLQILSLQTSLTREKGNHGQVFTDLLKQLSLM